MTRLYKINDTWRTYQDLHDSLGYTMQPSAEVSYVSSLDSDWGTDFSNHGYFSGLPDTDDQYDPSDGEYFEVDVYGWCSLDEMLYDVGLMPSNADTSIFFQKGSTISKAAVITPPRLDPIYCVSAELESGWHTYDWWEDNGWEETQPSSSLLFGGDFSGNDITLESVDGGGSVIDRYNPGRSLFPNIGWVDGTMITRYNPGRSLFELRGWEPGGCFWDILGNFIVMDSTTGNVISSVQIGNTDLPIEIDVLEQPEIIDPTAPTELLIGVTTECPAGTTSLNSEYFWMYQFYHADSANWYSPVMFQSSEPPFSQTDSTMYPVGGSKYLEVILTNGIGGTFSPTEFKLAVYNSAPEFYMYPTYTGENFDKSGAVVRYGSDIPTQSLSLPSDMYTISGTTITWNTSHPLMILLQGKPFEYV